MTTPIPPICEKLTEPHAWQCLIVRGDMSYWKNSAVPRDAASQIIALVAALERVASDCKLAKDSLGNSGPEFDSVAEAFQIVADRARTTLTSIMEQGRG